MRGWDLAQGDGQAQPDDRRYGYGQRLGPSPEVRIPAAPLRKNRLIRKRVAPAVNAVEHDCYGNACNDDVKESPRLDESMHVDSTVLLLILLTVYRPWLIVCHLLQKKRRYRR